MVILFTRVIASNPDQVILQEKPTPHNGKPWYCFDETACQTVIYWSNSGPNANKWVYSTTGLNGNAVSTLDNGIGSSYPLTYDYTTGDSDYWTNLDNQNQISSSISPYRYVYNPCKLENDDCLEELSLYFSLSEYLDLLDRGLIEASTVDGVGQICSIKNTLLSLNPSMTPTEVYEYYSIILDYGLVIDNSFDPCSVVIASVEEWADYAEAVATNGEIPAYSHNLITCNGEKVILYSNTPNLGPGVTLYYTAELDPLEFAGDSPYCTDSTYQTCYNVTQGDGVIQQVVFCV